MVTIPKPVAVPAKAVPGPARVSSVPGPKAVVAGTPAVAAAQPTAPSLVGQTIGNYKIIRRLGSGKWGSVYEALQTSMNRSVAMKILSLELQKDPAAKMQFIDNARAKANVQHPHILSVYEADETAGHCYFTHEFVEGDTFEELIGRERTIDEATALKVVKFIAEGLAYFYQNKIAHSLVEPSNIFIGSDSRPRLANLAKQDEASPEVQDEIRELGRIVSATLPGGHATSSGLASMFMRMKHGGQNGFPSWAALLQAVAALEPKVVPVDAFKLSAQDEAAIRAVEITKKKQKRQLIFSIAGAIAAVCISGVLLWRVFFANEKNLDVMVKIPAGDFIFQDGKKVTLPTFWIDQYEVTIGEYGRFLDHLKSHPSEAQKYDHSDQPKGKSHKPLNWDIYYGRAGSSFAKYRNVRFVPIDLNCPQFLVDWWDAYAYANWKGRRLPTEQEWEKAARGTDGRAYPWGNEFDPKKCNSSADYIDRPGPDAKGAVDGFFAWSPVDAVQGDKSPYGVYGMAGNVSEWTGTWVDSSAGKVPVIRGGNYHSPENKITKRNSEFDPEATNEYLGFRTASDTGPKK